MSPENLTTEPITKEATELLPPKVQKRLFFSRLLYIGWAVLGLMAFGLIAYGYYITFGPVKTIEVYNSPFPLVKSVLRPGDPIAYHVDLCRFTETTATVYPKLINGQIVTLPIYLSKIKPGCSKIISASNIVPLHTPPGTYYLELGAEYHISPLRTVYKTFRTQSFTVIK